MTERLRKKFSSMIALILCLILILGNIVVSNVSVEAAPVYNTLTAAQRKAIVDYAIDNAYEIQYKRSNYKGLDCASFSSNALMAAGFRYEDITGNEADWFYNRSASSATWRSVDSFYQNVFEKGTSNQTKGLKIKRITPSGGPVDYDTPTNIEAGDFIVFDYGVKGGRKPGTTFAAFDPHHMGIAVTSGSSASQITFANHGRHYGLENLKMYGQERTVEEGNGQNKTQMVVYRIEGYYGNWEDESPGINRPDVYEKGMNYLAIDCDKADTSVEIEKTPAIIDKVDLYSITVQMYKNSANEIGYCSEINKDYNGSGNYKPSTTEVNNVKLDKVLNYGFNNKNDYTAINKALGLTGSNVLQNNSEAKYVTQMAIWYALGQLTYNSNIYIDGKIVKANSNLVSYKGEIVAGNPRGANILTITKKFFDYINSAPTITEVKPTLKLNKPSPNKSFWDATTNSFLSGEYSFTVTGNVQPISVSVTGVNGAVVANDKETAKNTFNFNEQFYVKIPNNVGTGNLRVNISAKANMKVKGIHYQAVDSGLQSIVVSKDPVQENLFDSADTEVETCGTLKLIKTSEDGVVAGLNFNISGNGVNDNVTTGQNGEISINLLPGTYTVKEINVPGKYVEPESKQVTVTAGQTATVSFVNNLKKGYVELLKQGENDETLAGAIFGIYKEADNSKVGEITTGADGKGKSDVLVYGNYYLQEITAPPGHIKSDTKYPFTVLDSEQTVQIVAENKAIKAQIKIVKKDSETGKIIPIDGIEFKIKDSTGKYSETLLSVGGVVTLVEPLKYGKYELVEVNAPQGYLLNDKPISFEVKDDGVIVEIEFFNTPVKGRVQIEKKGDMVVGVKKIGSDLCTIRWEERGIPNVQYKIMADEDIYTADGTLRASREEVVDTITTDADGIAVSKELYLGKYKCVEIKAAEGYVLDTEPKYVTLEYKDQVTAIVTTTIGLTNMRQGIELDLVKHMETLVGAAKDFNPYIDVKFGVFTAEDVKGYDGTVVISKDNLVGVISVNELGIGRLSIQLPFAKYYVKEIATNNVYVLDETVYSVDIEYAGQDVVVNKIHINNGEAIINQLKRGEIQVYKTDGFTKKPIEDVIFALVDLDGNEIMRKSTDKNGYLSFGDLPYGEYMLKEIEAAKGYILNTKIEKIVLNDEYPIVKSEWQNQKIPEIPKLPRTGDVNILIFGIGAIFAGVGGVLAIKKRKRKI